MKFYFFKSSNTKDYISGISVFSNSPIKAIALAYNYFKKHKCKGTPELIAL